MAEPQAYIRFCGFTPEADRKKLYSMFGKFGKVTKLYLSPHSDFGKVYLDSTENCDRAYKGLKTNCGLKLTYVAPNSQSTFKHNDVSSNSSESYTDRSNRENSDDGVQANVTNNLVDVFGRLVTTLQDDYGNLYVSLNELKQSGFELFELGSLPARDGSRLHNQQKLHQFEMYMKAQANKFMLETHFNVPAHTVDEVIEKEKRSFFEIGDHVGTNSNMKSPGVQRDRSRSRGFVSPRSKNQEQNSNENFHSNKGSAINYNGNESRQTRNQRTRSEMNRSNETPTHYNSNEIQRNRSQHSYSEINRSKEITIKQDKNYDQEVNGNVKPIEKIKNDIKPLMQVPIVLNERQQMYDGTYILDELISDTSKLTDDKLTKPVENDANTETPLKLRQPHSVTPVMKECDKSEQKLKRKLVIDQLSDAGIFQFCEITSDQTFTGFALPDAYGNEFEMLSEIGANSTYDSKFIPNVGDVVGVEYDGDVARGLILNTTMGKYTCTLIDYGTTKVTHEVRQLPEKYTLIPEFSFECDATPNVIQRLQQINSTIAMRIKTPSKLSLCLESGETYEFIGRPIQSSPLQNDTVDTPQVITTPPRKVEESPIEKSPSTICKQKTVHEDKESNETIFMPRKLVIEDLSDRGTFDFIARTSDTTFNCFICPEKYLADINHLEMIYKDTSLDKSFKPKIGDLVAANSSVDGVVRAVVLNISDDKYECALIDYGTIQWISDVRLLPEKYVNIPEFVCECRADPEVTKDLENLKCQSITINVPCTLTLTFDNGKQHIVKGYRWDPTKLRVINIKKDNQCKTYKRPASMLLEDSDKVMIVGTLNDYLLVRNKECHATFTAVRQELANYEGKPYEQPEVGCLAICNFKDENLYRVAINKIDGAIATVDYIDFGNIDSVAINGLKTINEKLATMNSTLINIHLKDFTQDKFTKKMLEFLMNCNEKREKFNAHKVSGEKDVYDLVGMDGVSLTDKLNKVENNVTTPKLTMENKSAIPQSQDKNYCTTPKSQGESKSVKFNLPETSTPKSHRVAEPVCTLKDILKCDMKPGELKLLCTSVGNLNEGRVSFCKADDETSMILVYIDEMVSKCIEKDTSTSYIPTISEVCLAKFDGDWFRAAVVKVDHSNKFGVYFVDYGNHCIVDSTDIRKLPSELSTTKAQAMVCSLDGVVKENGKTVTDTLLSRLIVDIVESEIYTAKITSVCDNMYYIIIPSLLKQWKSDGLL